MIDLPDAPWIRDAEKYGAPIDEDVFCPVCGEENPEYFYIADNDVIGCSVCVGRCDPYDWKEKQIIEGEITND